MAQVAHLVAPSLAVLLRRVLRLLLALLEGRMVRRLHEVQRTFLVLRPWPAERLATEVVACRLPWTSRCPMGRWDPRTSGPVGKVAWLLDSMLPKLLAAVILMQDHLEELLTQDAEVLLRRGLEGSFGIDRPKLGRGWPTQTRPAAICRSSMLPPGAQAKPTQTRIGTSEGWQLPAVPAAACWDCLCNRSWRLPILLLLPAVPSAESWLAAATRTELLGPWMLKRVAAA